MTIPDPEGGADARGRPGALARVTINDVAERAGVSSMTVSRVLNAPERVQAETSRRVLAAIDALGYVPNRAAQTLAGRRAHRFGLLFGNPSQGYLSEFLLGVLAEANRLGLQIVLERSPDPLQAAQRLRYDQLDGVIVPAPACGDPAIRAEFARVGLPVVAVNADASEVRAPNVRIDNYAAAREMTRHLLGLGHREIGFITGPENQVSAGERLRGYRDALAEAGVAPDAGLVQGGAYTYRSGMEAAEALLRRTPLPTAIFAANDEMATAVLAAAHGRALRVPGDISVAGFDDLPIATAVWPALTTIAQPIGEVGAAAVQLLAEELARLREGETGDTAARHRVVAHKLVVRGSSGPPRPADAPVPGSR